MSSSTSELQRLELAKEVGLVHDQRVDRAPRARRRRRRRSGGSSSSRAATRSRRRWRARTTLSREQVASPGAVVQPGVLLDERAEDREQLRRQMRQRGDMRPTARAAARRCAGLGVGIVRQRRAAGPRPPRASRPRARRWRRRLARRRRCSTAIAANSAADRVGAAHARQRRGQHRRHLVVGGLQRADAPSATRPSTHDRPARRSRCVAGRALRRRRDERVGGVGARRAGEEADGRARARSRRRRRRPGPAPASTSRDRRRRPAPRAPPAASPASAESAARAGPAAPRAACRAEARPAPRGARPARRPRPRRRSASNAASAGQVRQRLDRGDPHLARRRRVRRARSPRRRAS